MASPYTITSSPPRILRGRGQVPLRDAIRISFGSAFRERFAHISTLIWGLAFGVISASYAPPAQRPLVMAASFAIAASIGYGSMFPWRWRLLPRNQPWYLMFPVNGTLALLLGMTIFFVAITAVNIGVDGLEALQLNRLKKVLWYSLYGFQYPVIGFYITLSADMAHREQIQRRSISRFERLAEQARLVALRSQINPHFFFNALNTIAALIPARPADAERAVELLATALRPVLTRDQPMLATLETELTVARAYTAIEELRLGERCNFQYKADPEALHCMMPSLSLQPLLENAVRHGASRVTGEYIIHLRAWREDNRLHLHIKNYEADAPTPALSGEQIIPVQGHALHNISERLRMLFGVGSELVVRRTGGNSADCRLTIPQEHAAVQSQ